MRLEHLSVSVQELQKALGGEWPAFMSGERVPVGAEVLEKMQRWITVHPWGKENDGIPVMIEDNGDGTGHVVAGAGGKLNFMRLNNLKSQDQLNEEAKARRKIKAEQRKEEKKAGIERPTPKEASQERRRKFVAEMAPRVGITDWELDETKFKGLTEAAKNVTFARHLRRVEGQIRRAVSEVKKGIVLDLERRREAALEELPLASRDADVISLMDLEGDPARTRGLGYARDVKQRAAERGKPEAQAEFERLIESGDLGAAREALRQVASELRRFETPKADKEAEAVEAAVKFSDKEFTAKAAETHDAALVRLEAEDVKARRRAAMEHPEFARNMEALMASISEEARIGKQIALQHGMEREEKTLTPAEQVALLRDAKRYDLEMRQIREAEGADAGGRERERRGIAVDFTHEDVDEAVLQDLQNRTMAMRNTAFLDEVAHIEAIAPAGGKEDAASMQRYYAEGAYNAVNRLAMNVSGSALVDRHAVDILGMQAVAHCIARHLRATRTDEDMAAVLKGLEDFHVAEQAEKVEEAMREARESMDAAKEIELGSIENPVDLVVAEELNERRRDLIVKAREVLGRTLGEFEATAALIMALKEKPRNGTSTNLGETAVDAAIREARSLGLTQGEDYDISDYQNDTRKMNLTARGMEKVIQTPDLERAMLYRDMQDIKEGVYDENDWIPSGMSRRRIDPTSIPPLPQLAFSEDMDLRAVTDPAKVRESVNDYILGRFNDGMSIEAIREDLYSAEFAVQHGITDKNAEAWIESVDELLPQVYPTAYAHDKTAHLRGPDGAPLPGRAAEHRKAWNDAVKDAAEQNRVLDGQIRDRLLRDSMAFAEREAARTGNPIPPLNDQDIDPTSAEVRESAFRAVAAHPGGMVAFKAVGDLNRADRSLLRRHYFDTYAKDIPWESEAPKDGEESKGPSLAKQWADLRAAHGEGVYREIQKQLKGKAKRGIFGVEVMPIAAVDLNDSGALAGLLSKEIGMSETSVRQALDMPQYKAQIEGELRNAAEEFLRRAWFTDVLGVSTDQYAEYQSHVANTREEAWSNYVSLMGGEREAYTALQHDLRGDVVERFSREYASLTGLSLKTAPVDLPGRDKHLKGTLPPDKMRDMLAKEQAKRAKELALAAERSRGKFAPGARKERAEAIREAMKRTGQRSLFRAGESATESYTPRERGRRYTIGERAEKQLAAAVQQVSRAMPFGKPLKLWNLSLNGDKIMGQRAIKALDRGHRVIFATGVGSGKTVMALGSFAHLHSQGKVKRALFAVPSIVQGQFGAESARYLEPGKFLVHAAPGENREARLAAMRDPANHIAVFTHQSLRDDTLYLLQKHMGIGEMRFRAMSRAERAAAVRDAFAKEGIDAQLMVLDEGHDALNRRGKPDSALAHVLDAIADNMPYYAPMTADPLKNDASEVFDWLTKLDPQRYPPDTRNDFLARYGSNTVSSREALQREIAPFWYSGRISLESRAHKHVVRLSLSPAQKAAYDHVHDLYNRARAARSRGDVDLEAIRELSPSSFEGLAPERQKETARWLSGSLGMLRESALSRVVNTYDGENAKAAKAVEIAIKGKAEGKPGVVFAHNLAAVDRLKKDFEAHGLRVGVITGRVSAKDKDAIKLGFNPERGAPKYDVLLCSDAGAIGMNAQTGKWLINYDTPDTAKTHNQRIGRIHRLGQQDDVDIYDLVTETAHETRRRDRLRRKYALGDIFQSPLEALDDSGLAHFIAKARAVQGQGKIAGPALQVAEGE